MMLINSFVFGSPSNLLLTFSGANNSNVFVDSSVYSHTMTTVGTPIQFDGQGVFDGNGYIYTDTLPAFLDKDFVITGSFSISSWPTGFQDPAIFGYNDPITVNPMGLLIGAELDGLYKYKKLYFFVYDSVSLRRIVLHQTDITLNTLHTFKVIRSGGFTRLFLDDVEADTAYASGTETVISNSSRFCIGKGGSTLSLFTGVIAEINVVVKG